MRKIKKLNPVWQETMNLYNDGLTVSEIAEKLCVDDTIIIKRITECKKLEKKKGKR